MSNTTTPMSHWLVHRLQLFACVTAASILAQGCAKQPAQHVTPETDTEAPVTEPVFVPPPPPPAPPVWSAVNAPPQSSASDITVQWLDLTEDGQMPMVPQLLPEQYTEVPGILSFREDGSRTNAVYGTQVVNKQSLRVVWTFETKETTPKAQNSSLKDWGGGAGWTGQPALVQWAEDTKQTMNLLPEHQADPDFVEVIQGSLDGFIYFLDMKTGKPSRTASFF